MSTGGSGEVGWGDQETGTCVSDWVLMLCAGQVRSHHREKAGEGKKRGRN